MSTVEVQEAEPSMLRLFNCAWEEVPIIVIDVETTGLVPGVDAAVQVALVRFEKRKIVGRLSALLNPGRLIPAEATAIHGITDKKVRGHAHVDEYFGFHHVRELLKGAQPAAYNASFDQRFVPASAFEDWRWPWLDPLIAVRAVDRYVRGSGRHKLSAACERRGIPLVGAHDAGADAEATGYLLYHVLSEVPAILDQSLGTVLAWQMRTEADQWGDFNKWRSEAAEAAGAFMEPKSAKAKAAKKPAAKPSKKKGTR